MSGFSHLIEGGLIRVHTQARNDRDPVSIDLIGNLYDVPVILIKKEVSAIIFELSDGAPTTISPARVSRHGVTAISTSALISTVVVTITHEALGNRRSVSPPSGDAYEVHLEQPQAYVTS